jgi:hypothetical protein
MELPIANPLVRSKTHNSRTVATLFDTVLHSTHLLLLRPPPLEQTMQKCGSEGPCEYMMAGLFCSLNVQYDKEIFCSTISKCAVGRKRGDNTS